MRRFLALCLVISMIFASVCLSSCEGDGDSYAPVESTEEEARVLMTFKLNGIEYKLRYELYRALFSNLYEAEERTAEEESSYLAALDEKTVRTAAGIYAVIAEAKKIGCDVMGSTGDDFVKDAITDAVGEGSYDDYLQGLSDLSMNYAVADLMFRYSLALSEVDDYYLGNEDEDTPIVGKLTYTEEEVSAFYGSNECVRVLKAFLPSNAKTRADAEAFRVKLAAKTTDMDAALYIVSNTLADGSEIINSKTHTVSGSIVTKYGTESVYFSTVSEAAFSLSAGEVSNVIFAAGESQAGYYVIRGLEKNSSHYADYFDDIAAAYLENELGKLLENSKEAMLSSASKEALYTTLDRSTLINQ